MADYRAEFVAAIEAFNAPKLAALLKVQSNLARSNSYTIDGWYSPRGFQSQAGICSSVSLLLAKMRNLIVHQPALGFWSSAEAIAAADKLIACLVILRSASADFEFEPRSTSPHSLQGAGLPPLHFAALLMHPKVFVWIMLESGINLNKVYGSFRLLQLVDRLQYQVTGHRVTGSATDRVPLLIEELFRDVDTADKLTSSVYPSNHPLLVAQYKALSVPVVEKMVSAMGKVMERRRQARSESDAAAAKAKRKTKKDKLGPDASFYKCNDDMFNTPSLVDKGSRNIQDWETPLHKACEEGAFEAAVVLLASGLCQMDVQNYHGQTPLHIVICNVRSGPNDPVSAREKIVAALLAAGASPFVKDSKGMLPVHYARSKAMVKLFVAAGCNPAEQSVKKGAIDLLTTACSLAQSPQLVSYLLSLGYSADGSAGEVAQGVITPLQSVLKVVWDCYHRSSTDAVRIAFIEDAIPRNTTRDQMYAMFLEVKILPMVKALLEYGADPNLIRSPPAIPLYLRVPPPFHMAASMQAIDVMQALCDAGADIALRFETSNPNAEGGEAVSTKKPTKNARNLLCSGNADAVGGSTALEVASRNKCTSVVQFLIKEGGVGDGSGHEGGQDADDGGVADAIGIAVRVANLAALKSLTYGRTANIRDRCGWTLLHTYVHRHCPYMREDGAGQDARRRWQHYHRFVNGPHTSAAEPSAGPTAMLEFLISNGCDVHDTTPAGFDALRLAILGGVDTDEQRAIVRLLISKYGADPNRLDASGWSAVHTAAMIGFGVEDMIIASAAAVPTPIAIDLDRPTNKAIDGLGLTPLDLSVYYTAVKARLALAPFHQQNHQGLAAIMRGHLHNGGVVSNNSLADVIDSCAGGCYSATANPNCMDSQITLLLAKHHNQLPMPRWPVATGAARTADLSVVYTPLLSNKAARNERKPELQNVAEKRARSASSSSSSSDSSSTGDAWDALFGEARADNDDTANDDANDNDNDVNDNDTDNAHGDADNEGTGESAVKKTRSE